MVKFEDLEIWDYIKGYENLYKVSSKGQVFSVKRNKYLKPRSNGMGYYIVNLCKDGKCKSPLIHRLVALTFYFVDDGADKLQVDHIDRDKTNNNLLNLRFCSGSENQMNIAIRQNNTSGYKGVYWDKTGKKWRARICINGDKKSLGRFKTKEEAYETYKKASKKLHGDFGYAP